MCDELPVDVEEDLQATNFHLAELRSAATILKKWVGYQAEEGEGTIPLVTDVLMQKGALITKYEFDDI